MSLRKPEGMEWLVVIAIIVKIGLFLFVCFCVYLLWDNRSEIVERVIPDDMVTRPLDVYCPEESYMLKQMYFYDHVKKEKVPLLVGSQEMIDNAVKSMGDKKTMTHICNY